MNFLQRRNTRKEMVIVRIAGRNNMQIKERCDYCNRLYEKDEMRNFNDGSPVCIYCYENQD